MAKTLNNGSEKTTLNTIEPVVIILNPMPKTEGANGTIQRHLEWLVNGQWTSQEDQLSPVLTAIRDNVSVVTGFSPFMLHHACPAHHTIGRMVDGSIHPTWGARSQLQGDIMARAAKATKESQTHN